MNGITKIKAWGDLHHPKILDILRILTGVFFLVRGINFFNNSGYLRDLIIANKIISQSPQIILPIVNYVTYIHLLSGFLILIGFFTRMAVLLELPISLGAIFSVKVISPVVNSELWLSIIIFALLLLFLIIGSGPLSFDHILSRIRMEKVE